MISCSRHMIPLRLSTFLVLTGLIAISAHFEFNNVKCISRGEDFLAFEYCYLKSINRTYKYFSVRCHLYQTPITNAVVAFKIVKRDNRNIHEQFNGSVDACKFLKFGRNPIAKVIFNTFAEYSNMNHTCPYAGDIVLEKLPVQHVNNIIKNFIPDGRYYLNLTFSAYNISRADVVVYFTKT